MTEDDLGDVMAYVEATWRNQLMTAAELAAWRNELRSFELSAIVETISAYQGIWRPSIKELGDFHRSRMRYVRETTKTGPTGPVATPETAARFLAEARAHLTGAPA